MNVVIKAAKKQPSCNLQIKQKNLSGVSVMVKGN